MAFLLERPHIVMCVNFKCEFKSCPWFPLKTSFVGQQQIWRPAGPLPIDREEAASQPPPLAPTPCGFSAYSVERNPDIEQLWLAV